jgi:subtilisin
MPLAPEGDVILSKSAGTVDVIVVLNEKGDPLARATNRARASEIARGMGIEPRSTYGAVLFGFAATIPEVRLEALRRHPLVAYVDHDRRVSIPPTIEHHRPGHGPGKPDPEPEPEPEPDPSPQVTPWGINRIGAAPSGETGLGISVYVLDTGIDPDHPDLADNLGEGYAVIECSGCKFPWADDRGHGTHVAGTVAALDNEIGVVGVAPQATLHSVKVLGSNGSGTWSGVIEGIDWVAADQPGVHRVINMSLGGQGPSVRGECVDSPSGEGPVWVPFDEANSDAMHESLCNARRAGVVTVTSAGNAGANAVYYSPAMYHDAVITVSASWCTEANYEEVDERCTGGIDWTAWSNWGWGTDDAWPSRNSLPVLIAAPGLNVRSTIMGGDIGYMSGTSMAAPHVAGAIALLLQAPEAGTDPFPGIRQKLLDYSECTANWENTSGNPHTESFLSVSGSDGECAPAPLRPPPPSDLTATALSDSEIRLTWTSLATDAAYEIQRAEEGTSSGYALIDTTDTGAEEYNDDGLKAGTGYIYRVRAVRDGMASDWYHAHGRTGDGGELAASFTYDCGNSDVCSFTDTSTGLVTEWRWSFGDGEDSSESTDRNPWHRYTGPGSFDVTLTLNGDEMVSETRTIECRTTGRNLRCK